MTANCGNKNYLHNAQNCRFSISTELVHSSFQLLMNYFKRFPHWPLLSLGLSDAMKTNTAYFFVLIWFTSVINTSLRSMEKNLGMTKCFHRVTESLYKILRF